MKFGGHSRWGSSSPSVVFLFWGGRGGRAIKAEGVCRLVLLDVRKCGPFGEEILCACGRVGWFGVSAMKAQYAGQYFRVCAIVHFLENRLYTLFVSGWCGSGCWWVSVGQLPLCSERLLQPLGATPKPAPTDFTFSLSQTVKSGGYSAAHLKWEVATQGRIEGPDLRRTDVVWTSDQTYWQSSSTLGSQVEFQPRISDQGSPNEFYVECRGGGGGQSPILRVKGAPIVSKFNCWAFPNQWQPWCGPGAREISERGRLKYRESCLRPGTSISDSRVTAPFQVQLRRQGFRNRRPLLPSRFLDYGQSVLQAFAAPPCGPHLHQAALTRAPTPL